MASPPIDSFISDILNPSESSTTTRTTFTRSSSSSSSSTTFSTSSSTPSTTSTTSSRRTTSTSTSTSTTSSFSTTFSSFSTPSPTLFTSTSASLSGTRTVEVVVTQTTLTPSRVTTVRPTNSSHSNSGGANGALIGGIVGGVVGGLLLIAGVIALCVATSRRRSRDRHFEKDDLGYSGGAWPTFDPNDDYHRSSSYGAAAASGAAAYGISRRNRRREHTQATLPPGFANDQDPEAYGPQESSTGHDAFSAGYSNDHEMHERVTGGTAAGGYFAAGKQRRSSHGHHSYGSNDALNNMSPGQNNANLDAPAPWTIPMLGSWTGGDHGPYSAAGVGHAPPQAFHMMGPGEGRAQMMANSTPQASQSRSTGPDYSHFDPPEVRDARARQEAAAAAATAALSSGTFNSHPSALIPGPTSPPQANRRLSSNQSSPRKEHATATISPPAYVDANEEIEQVDHHHLSQTPRLHLTNAEPELTDEESSRGGPRRP